MEAPCKICGEKHYGMCAPLQFTLKPVNITGKPTAAITRGGVTRKAEIIGPNGPVLSVGDLKAGDVLVLKEKLDRNVYQREYMRRRRAKKP